MADQQKQLKEQAIEIEKLKAEQALTTESHGCEALHSVPIYDRYEENILT